MKTKCLKTTMAVLFSILLFGVWTATTATAAPDNGPRAEITKAKVSDSGRKVTLYFYNAGDATYTLQVATSQKTVTKITRTDFLTYNIPSTFVKESWKTLRKTDSNRITLNLKQNKAYRFRVKVQVHGGMKYESIPVDLYTGKVSVFTHQNSDKFKIDVFGSKKYTKYCLRGYKANKYLVNSVERKVMKKAKNGKVTFTEPTSYTIDHEIGKYQVKAYKGKKLQKQSLKFKMIERRQNATDTKGTKLHKDALYYMNKYRKEHGLKEVKWSTRLEYGTRLRAKDQCTFFGHVRPEGQFESDEFLYMLTPTIKNDPICGSSYLKGTKIPCSLGSNLYSGKRSVKKVFEAWMDSEGHRALILEPEATEMCYATYYWNGQEAAVLMTLDVLD